MLTNSAPSRREGEKQARKFCGLVQEFSGSEDAAQNIASRIATMHLADLPCGTVAGEKTLVAEVSDVCSLSRTSDPLRTCGAGDIPCTDGCTGRNQQWVVCQ
jgi:hypothetical protein